MKNFVSVIMVAITLLVIFACSHFANARRAPSAQDVTDALLAAQLFCDLTQDDLPAHAQRACDALESTIHGARCVLQEVR